MSVGSRRPPSSVLELDTPLYRPVVAGPAWLVITSYSIHYTKLYEEEENRLLREIIEEMKQERIQLLEFRRELLGEEIYAAGVARNNFV